MKKNLVIIANYNQHIEVENYLTEVLQYIPRENVVVIDDGSTDGSDQIAQKLGFVVLRHLQNLGIGAALRTGLHYARDNGFEGVLISSSNGKMVPSQFPGILKHLDDGPYEYIQGSRFMKEGKSENLPLFRQLMIPVLSWFWSFILGQKNTDITCGLRAYKMHLIQNSRINIDQDWLNRYELEYYLHIKFLRDLKVRMKEVPVIIRYTHLQSTRRSKIKPVIGWISMARPFVLLIFKIKR